MNMGVDFHVNPATVKRETHTALDVTFSRAIWPGVFFELTHKPKELIVVSGRRSDIICDYELSREIWNRLVAKLKGQRRPPHHLTPLQEQGIVQDYLCGVPTEEIKKKYNTSSGKIFTPPYGVLPRHGIVLNRAHGQVNSKIRIPPQTQSGKNYYDPADFQRLDTKETKTVSK
jgi:hypothetical protein